MTSHPTLTTSMEALQVSSGGYGNEPRKARYFYEGQPLAEQIAMFKSMAEQGPFDTARCQLITPELAKWIVDNHTSRNRKLRPGHVKKLAAVMAGGGWGVTGQTITMSRMPVTVVDGHHRFAACVASGEAIRTWMVFGADRDEFVKVDTGKNRTPADTLAALGAFEPGTLATMLKWEHALGRDPTKPEPLGNGYFAQRLADLREGGKEDLYQGLCSLGRTIAKNTRLDPRDGGVVHNSGQLAALLHMFHKVKPTEAEAFVKALEANSKSVALPLSKRLAALKVTSNLGETTRAATVVLAFNHYLEHGNVVASSIKYDADRGFPTVGE